METKKMEINMRDGILKMTVMGKTLKVDIMDEDAPIHYKARPFPYDLDETELDQAVEGMKGVKNKLCIVRYKRVKEFEKKRENHGELIFQDTSARTPKKRMVTKEIYH